jgi:hypothetical protein
MSEKNRDPVPDRVKMLGKDRFSFIFLQNFWASFHFLPSKSHATRMSMASTGNYHSTHFSMLQEDKMIWIRRAKPDESKAIQEYKSDQNNENTRS